MIVRELKVFYRCTNTRCNLPVKVTMLKFAKNRDVTQIWTEIHKKMTCHVCQYPLRISRVRCKVSTDIFGTDIQGVWMCVNHPEKPFYTIPLRKAFYGQNGRGILDQLYREVVGLGFPWKCPTCKEQMIYAEDRDNIVLG